jgi:parallel beta-helix repeat protein
MGNMKKFAIGVIIFIFLASSFLSILIITPIKADGNAIYVDKRYHTFRDGSAENPYETIQYAIDIAEAGDTIYVFGGTYNETLVIDKNITIMGSIDSGNTIINKNDRNKYTVQITADYVTFERFTITDPNNYNLVSLLYVTSNNVVVQGNNFTDSKTWGIYLFNSDDNTLGGNFLDGTRGVNLYSSNNNVFSNNNFTNCQDYGISMSFSSGETIIYDNVFYDCKYSIYGLSSSNNNITKNKIINSTFHGVKLSGGSNNVLYDNYIRDCGSNGIDIGSSDSKIIDNTLKNNQVGLLLGGSYCQVKENNILDSTIGGISALSTNNNVIYLNRLSRNFVYNAKEEGDNHWYYGNQGNYWDDYDDIDIDLDKVGDSPYKISSGGQDLYPLGYFLKPPEKPGDPSPEDGEDQVGLSVTLSVEVSDPDSETVDVFFYSATDDKLYGVDYRVPDGEEAYCSFTLPFQTTFLWYTTVTDGRLENKSNIWIFTTRQIPPLNTKPVADPGGKYFATLDQEITFDGSESYDSDGEIDFYRWNFGDGSSEILDIHPSHSYSEEGVYTVTLTVVDNDGRSSTETTTATISSTSDFPPVPEFTAPNSTKANSLFTVDASNSYDADGAITNYTWNFGDGTIKYGLMTSHKYSNAGTYTVMLTITDDRDNTETTYSVVSVTSSSEDTPGFELVIGLIAITFFVFYSKKRKTFN